MRVLLLSLTDEVNIKIDGNVKVILSFCAGLTCILCGETNVFVHKLLNNCDPRAQKQS